MWAADLPVCPQIARLWDFAYIGFMVIRRRLEIKGPALVFVTTSAKERISVFSLKSVALTILDQLRLTLSRFDVSLVGYVIMPTHVHLLLGFRDIRLLSKFVQAFKSLSSRRVKQLDLGRPRIGLEGRKGFSLWMPRFDDVVIFSHDQFRIKLDYIHNNPVKAELVKKSVDWEYSSAGAWLEGRPGLIEIDKDFYWTDG